MNLQTAYMTFINSIHEFTDSIHDFYRQHTLLLLGAYIKILILYINFIGKLTYCTKNIALKYAE